MHKKYFTTCALMQAWCLKCCKNVVIEQRYDVCPDCGNGTLEVNAGEQMRIKELKQKRIASDSTHDKAPISSHTVVTRL
jgi:hypothetical protein